MVEWQVAAVICYCEAIKYYTRRNRICVWRCWHVLLYGYMALAFLIRFIALWVWIAAKWRSFHWEGESIFSSIKWWLTKHYRIIGNKKKTKKFKKSSIHNYFQMRTDVDPVFMFANETNGNWTRIPSMWNVNHLNVKFADRFTFMWK